MAVSRYDKKLLSQYDQDRIESLTKAAESGNITWDSAHNAAEAIRAKAGYSGGDEGNEYNPDFSSTYWKNYSDSGTLDKLRNMSYGEWTKGSEYQALKDTYQRQSNLAMQDTLAQIASRTGGLASSYATVAAQQQYSNVMERLNDIARSMYENDRNALMDVYDAELDADNIAYSRQRDALSDALYERQYADTLLERQREQEEQERAEAQERIGAFLGANGSLGNLDAGLIKQSGYTQSELEAFEDYYANLLAQQNAKAYSGGGSGTGVTAEESEFYDDILKKAQEYEDYDEAIAYLDRMVGAGRLSEDEKNTIDTVYLGGVGKDTGEEDARVSNNQTNGGVGVEIPGHGYYTWDSLYRLVESGRVREEYDEKTNTYTYKWVG